MTAPEPKWHPHKPGDPMPVDGETMVVVRLRNGETDVDRAGQYSWDDECGYSIDAYRYVNPADEPEAEPTRRTIQVGDEVRHELGPKKVGTVLAIAGQEAAVLWTYGLRSHDLHLLRLAGPDPAQQSEPVKPKRCWISVQEQPHPTDGKTWFWSMWRTAGCSPCIADLKCDSITHWCPLLEQPPEFVDPPKPLTDAEKLATAVGALKEAIDAYGKPGGPWNVPIDPGGWLNRATEALAKIEGKK